MSKPQLQYIAFILVAVLALCAPPPICAVDLGDSVLRDYPVSLPLHQKRVELSIDYARIDDSLMSDKTQPANASYLNSGPERSDMAKVLLNYGLFDLTTLQTGFHYQRLNYKLSDIDLKSFDISVKQTVSDNMFGWLPFIAFDAGLKTNFADDLTYHEKIDDKTLFIRLTAGEIFGNLFPNAYIEYGYTDIDAVADADAGTPPGSGMGLDRTESYMEAGLCVLWKFPYTALIRAEYSYLRMIRDDGMGGPESNHIARANFNYFLTEGLIINVGWTYYHRELNGVVPLLFNENTADEFDRKAVETYVGFTLLFEGG